MTAIANGPNVTPSPRLTPERVRKMMFTRTQIGRRGYSEEEVNLFLERVAEDIAARDAEDASMRAMVLHYQNTLADWRAGYRDAGGNKPATTVVPSVEAVNILSRAQQEADSYVAQTQAYCRRLACSRASTATAARQPRTRSLKTLFLNFLIPRLPKSGVEDSRCLSSSLWQQDPFSRIRIHC